jgi:hypothetical protein
MMMAKIKGATTVLIALTVLVLGSQGRSVSVHFLLAFRESAWVACRHGTLLRLVADGLVYHALNRGNNRAPVFLKRQIINSSCRRWDKLKVAIRSDFTRFV